MVGHSMHHTGSRGPAINRVRAYDIGLHRCVFSYVEYGLWWHVQRATMLVCPHERASEVRSRLGNSKTRKQWRQKNGTDIGEDVFGVVEYEFDANISASLLFINYCPGGTNATTVPSILKSFKYRDVYPT
jgi:hypothetical protein